MRWADSLRRLRDRLDPPQEPAPDDLAVLAVVASHEGPMLASALEAIGIIAQLEDVSFLAGRLPAKARIVVRHKDMDAAVDLLRELRPSIHRR